MLLQYMVCTAQKSYESCKHAKLGQIGSQNFKVGPLSLIDH